MPHNYPKQRKSAIKTTSQKRMLMAKYSLEYIQDIWIEHGMYKGAELLNDANPFVLFHLAREYKWKRPIPEHLYKAYLNGDWKISERHYIDMKGGEQ